LVRALDWMIKTNEIGVTRELRVSY